MVLFSEGYLARTKKFSPSVLCSVFINYEHSLLLFFFLLGTGPIIQYGITIEVYIYFYGITYRCVRAKGVGRVILIYVHKSGSDSDSLRNTNY